MTHHDLAEIVEIESNNLLTCVSDINELRGIIAERNPDKFQIAAMSKLLSDAYCGIENILKQICKYLRIPLPTGAFYHTELLLLFSKPSEKNLPILIDSKIFDDFKAWLKFRHYTIHGYAFKLDWAMIVIPVDKAELLVNHFLKNIKKFLNNDN